MCRRSAGPPVVVTVVDRYGSGVEFGLLGPLEVVHEGRLVPIRAGKQRALLAALLLRTGRSVPLGELVDIIWGDRSPANPRSTIQIYVNRLRAAVGGII